ncbi:MAG TPA: hypothetical protein P5543_06250 [Planctomycetota bacterium]|nr:hypothetical protein [Planctomycetota bacterium]HRU51774.1 hypothetical protein [Planctomycetota bacterium]
MRECLEMHELTLLWGKYVLFALRRNACKFTLNLLWGEEEN